MGEPATKSPGTRRWARRGNDCRAGRGAHRAALSVLRDSVVRACWSEPVRRRPAILARDRRQRLNPSEGGGPCGRSISPELRQRAREANSVRDGRHSRKFRERIVSTVKWTPSPRKQPSRRVARCWTHWAARRCSRLSQVAGCKSSRRMWKSGRTAGMTVCGTGVTHPLRLRSSCRADFNARYPGTEDAGGSAPCSGRPAAAGSARCSITALRSAASRHSRRRASCTSRPMRCAACSTRSRSSPCTSRDS